MSDLTTVRDCDQLLDYLSRKQTEAIRAKAFWKLANLERQKNAAVEQRKQLQHGDFFRASPFDQMRAQCQ